jgi:hypothetical protein
MTDPRYARPLAQLETTELPGRMQSAIRAVQRELPPGAGIIVFAFDFGNGGALAYIANAQREDCIAALEEWIRKQRTEQN